MRANGDEAEHFLENLVTCSVTNLAEGEARFGALLTPQGKIMFDFFIIRHDGGFLIDVMSDQAGELLKRLTFYRLRAKVEMAPLPDMKVICHQGDAPDATILSIADPRHPGLPKRAYGHFHDTHDTVDLDAARIELGIPEGGKDFEYGEAFPHDVLMDKMGSVDFKKGCYVGQEVVSRMQHKSTIRKRVIKISAETKLPPSGTAILADDKPCGTVGTVKGHEGLAMLRLDRGEKAETITAGNIKILCKRPDWLQLDWPQDV